MDTCNRYKVHTLLVLGSYWVSEIVVMSVSVDSYAAVMLWSSLTLILI